MRTDLKKISNFNHCSIYLQNGCSYLLNKKEDKTFELVSLDHLGKGNNMHKEDWFSREIISNETIFNRESQEQFFDSG